MKTGWLIVVVLFLGVESYAQTVKGALNIDASFNTDNKLKNNQVITELNVCVINNKTKDTLLNQLLELPYMDAYERGSYTVVATYPGYEMIIEREIIVSADRITFVRLLFEPKQKKRKHFNTGKD